MESSSSPHRSPEQEERAKPHKIFVTNLEVDVAPNKLETELEEKFGYFGKLDSVVVKKSYNSEYCFAFIEFKEGEDASTAVGELNGTSCCGKKMKVELQDNARRRKGGNETCFICGKTGHYARNCRQNREREHESRSESEDRHRHRHHKKSKKKKHHRHRSDSSESDSRRRKDKKKSKKVKKHSSKHKKSRRHSSSSSR